MSCYAFFEWWLPLSQHPGCLSVPTSLHTRHGFWGLIWRSGLLPSRRRNLSPADWLRCSAAPAFLVWSGRKPLARPLPIQWLYLRRTCSRPSLKMFRGEPAITRLDWNFTTCHNSSAGVSTNVGSDLHRVSPLLHPGHGKIAGFRVQMRALVSPCSGSLSLRLRVFPLVSRAHTDSQAHSSIGTASGFNALRLLVGTRFQDLFHSPPGVLFTFPSRYSFAIGSQIVFSLGGRSPRVRPGSLVPRLTLGTCRPGRPFGYGGFALFAAPFQALPLGHPFGLQARTPALAGLGSSAFARHYSRNRSLFLFLPVL